MTTINTQHNPWWSFMPHTTLQGISVEEPFSRSPLRSLWRLACGDRAAPGSLPLIPPDGGTHALHIADASPPNKQT